MCISFSHRLPTIYARGSILKKYPKVNGIFAKPWQDFFALLSAHTRESPRHLVLLLDLGAVIIRSLCVLNEFGVMSILNETSLFATFKFIFHWR
jgi:hypothetical protein